MALVLIGIVSLLTAGVTLFSGFGVGTILLPVFALFFPVSLAVAATAVVHFLNNLVKLGLMARHASYGVVARFGIPAAVAALGGASLLGAIEGIPPLLSYTLGGSTFSITAVKLVIGALIVAFALLELSARFQALSFAPRWLPLGGVLSGFFGGLSGMQGALRSAFLLKSGLDKDAYVATGVVAAVLVDASRLAVYGATFLTARFAESREVMAPVIVATACAAVGSIAGKQVLRKVTMDTVRRVVAAAMLVIGAGLVTGLV
jgi:uncharacterized protein